MLKIIHSLKELDFSQLMSVYAQTNRQSGAREHSQAPAAQQVICAEQDFYAYLRESFFATSGAFYAVWMAEGCYSAALRVEPYRDGLLLTALETVPELRRNGYATALVSAVLRYLKGQGSIRIYSHVDKKNHASLAVHEACGFQRIMEHAVYLDGSVLRSACTFCYELK